jgi:hypothetical protein
MSGNYRYIPYAQKELVCDMARRVTDVGLLSYQAGFGRSSTYKWLKTSKQHGVPALPRAKSGPKFALDERDCDVSQAAKYVKSDS